MKRSEIELKALRAVHSAAVKLDTYEDFSQHSECARCEPEDPAAYRAARSAFAAALHDHEWRESLCEWAQIPVEDDESPAPAASGELAELPSGWGWEHANDAWRAVNGKWRVEMRSGGILASCDGQYLFVAPIAVILAVVRRNSEGGGK